MCLMDGGASDAINVCSADASCSPDSAGVLLQGAVADCRPRLRVAQGAVAGSASLPGALASGSHLALSKPSGRRVKQIRQNLGSERLRGGALSKSIKTLTSERQCCNTIMQVLGTQIAGRLGCVGVFISLADNTFLLWT